MRLTGNIGQCIGLAALFAVAACSTEPARKPGAVSSGNAGVAGLDPGSNQDDGGAAGTGGMAGAPEVPAGMSGGGTNAFPPVDAGPAEVAPPPPDAASPPDKSGGTAGKPAPDAGPPALDADKPDDGGKPAVDAGPPADAGKPTDAGPPPDTGKPIDVPAPVDGGPLVERFGFGSCNELTKPQIFWPKIVERQPQVFLFLGDNAYLDYGDTYEKLGALPGFKSLLAIARPLAIWDDHDFGTNDGGGAFTGKDSYKKKFIDFWGSVGAVPAGSPRRTRPGNYDSAILGPIGRQVQFIMLDNRYFKGAAPSGTVLGDAQWQWLSEELRKPASLRVIMSGFQALGSSTSSEGWGEYPAEQQHLLDVIKASQAKGVVIVSGDKHYAEISRRENVVGYPLYDFTSSSLSASNSYAPEANTYRDTPTSASQNHNFGLMTIDWNTPGRPLTVQIFDAGTGAVLLSKNLSLSTLGSQ